MTQMSLALFAISCALLVCPTHSSSDAELLPYEPVQYLRAQLSPAQPTPLTEYIKEATPTQAADFMTKAKALLKSHLKNSDTSVVLVRGEKVLVQRRAMGVQWDSKIHLPHSNMVSLISVILPILLEGYKGSMIRDPIGQVLRGKDREHSLVTGSESMSLLDLLNKLPSGGKTVKLDSPALLNSLLASGELSTHFVNSVLSAAAHEAWMDALMALGSTDIKREESGQLIMDINSLLQSTLTVMHDLKVIGAVPKRERLPLDDGKYLFGWWFNCPKELPSNCLIPHAPTDTIFSLSPDLRLYVTPSLELTLIILGPGATAGKSSKSFGSVADILIEDAEIWRQFALSVESSGEEGTSQRVTNSDNDSMGSSSAESRNEDKASQTASEDQEAEVVGDADTKLADFIHWIWPTLVFLFWVTFSHVWVYWTFHTFWFFLTSISSKTHIPRPQTAAEVGSS